jgi:arylsulfatase A-like enzyme
MNVILLMSDTFRRDNLSCYAPSAVQTPHLDAFANRAAVFKNAYTGSFPTVPNRLDIMSGRFSHVEYEWCPLPAQTVPLQQVLTVSGIVTQMIVDNPHLVEDGFNYCRGFSGWDWIRGQETDAWKSLPREVRIPASPKKMRTHFVMERHLRNTAWWTREEDRFAPRTIRAACDWLEEAARGSGAFYLYLDLFDPHEPWDAPQDYLDRYDPGYQGEPLLYSSYGFWKEIFSEREFQHMRAQYMAESTMVDRWIGVLLDKIEALGLTEDTAVIFTSDHGYLFGEHDLTGKSLLPQHDGQYYYEAIPLYRDIRSIPLLIRLPGQTTRQDIDALVQPVDLMPTILEMAGLVTSGTVSGQSQMQALQCGVFYTKNWQLQLESIQGKSLMPLLRGETRRHRDITVSSETLLHHSPIPAKSAIVTEDGWCLHYYGSYGENPAPGAMAGWELINPKAARIPTAPMLFNLSEDPDEQHNVIESHEARAWEIHQRYVRWLEEAGTPLEHLQGRRSLR